MLIFPKIRTHSMKVLNTVLNIKSILKPYTKRNLKETPLKLQGW